MTSPYEFMFEADFYAKGLAVGESRIMTDTMYFRFRGEEFEFPSERVHHLCKYQRGFATVEVERLRALKG